jgi:hypothetical protein
MTDQVNVTIPVTKRLQSLPCHPVARSRRGNWEDLLQCLEFFETVFFLSVHHDKPCFLNQSYFGQIDLSIGYKANNSAITVYLGSWRE